MRRPRLLLVDANNLLVRAERATERAGMQADGVNTGALLVFINALTRHIRAEEPDEIVVCWDGGRSQWRIATDPSYKANRPQAPTDETRPHGLAAQFLRLARIPTVEYDGWEADDLIAGYCRDYDGTREILVLSSDHDLNQLVGTYVTQLKMVNSGDPAVRIGPIQVQDKYGCTPDRLPMLMALTGDPGDGLAGLAGIGPVKARKMLAAVDWDWTELLCTLSPENSAIARRTRSLVDLRTPHPDLPGLPEPVQYVPPARLSPAEDALVSFLASLRMETVIGRLRTGSLWSEGLV
jgi:DNA polymerase I